MTNRELRSAVETHVIFLVRGVEKYHEKKSGKMKRAALAECEQEFWRIKGLLRDHLPDPPRVKKPTKRKKAAR